MSVTQDGSYRVNDRELINSSPDTLRAAILEVAGADRNKPVTVRADARATHQSVVTAMDVLGKLGFVRINIATVEDSHAGEMNTPAGAAPIDAGACIAGCSATRDRISACSSSASSAWRCSPRPDRPSPGWCRTSSIWASSRKIRACCGSCRSARRCCSCCAASATTSACISRATCRARSSRRCARDLFRQYLQLPREVLRPAIDRHDALAAHVQHRTGGRGHDQFHRRADPRFADHHPADRLAVRAQLEAGAVRADPRAAAVVAHPPGDEIVPPLQRAHPGLDGRRHARHQGSARRPARHQGVQRAGTGSARLRGGERAQPPQQHEAHRREGDQQSGGAVHRVAGSRRRVVDGAGAGQSATT